MEIYRLDHGNIRTNNLADMVAWYEDVLGFRRGWRPDFGFGGAWMYCEDQPFVHLVEETAPLGERGDIRLEHVAFSAHGREGFCARLDSLGVEYKETPVPGAGVVQINIWDPDGNHIHVDFALNEDEATK